MLNIKMEYKKGVFFIRLEGNLTHETNKMLENEALPLLLDQGIKKVVINLDKLLYLDRKGVGSLLKIEKVIRDNNGIMSLCSITSNEVKNVLHEKFLNRFYESNNELTAIGEMKI